MSSILEEYWRGVAQRLQIEADQFNSHAGHRGEIGRANEASLGYLLGNLLPTSVHLGTGIMLNHLGSRSPQTDIIVYSVDSQPRLLAQTMQTLYPIETVNLAIEVKTTLTPTEVDDVGSKFKEIRAMYREVHCEVPHLSLFAYRMGNSHPVTVIKKIKDLEDDEQPDSFCVLRPACFGRDQIRGLVPLHEVDSDGDRISLKWQSPETPKPSDSAYPPTRVMPYSSKKVVTEPGRALLLYANCLMDALATRGVAKNDWLGNYLPQVAREVMDVG